MFPSNRSFYRPATAFAAAVLVAMLGPALPAAGAAPFFTFDIELGDTSLYGTGPANSDILLVLRDRDGFVKDRAPATTDGTGFLQMTREFHATIDTGDSIRATDGVAAHTR